MEEGVDSLSLVSSSRAGFNGVHLSGFHLRPQLADVAQQVSVSPSDDDNDSLDPLQARGCRGGIRVGRSPYRILPHYSEF